MNIYECGFSYFRAPITILELRPKALATALRLLRDGSGRPPTWWNGVPVRERRLLEELASKASGDAKQIMLPSRLRFDELSNAARKTIIACYQKSRYSRTPFRFICTREELAEAAHISGLQHLRRALKELQAMELIDVKPIWKKGIQVSLLDPEFRSGTPMYWIVQFHLQRLETVPAYAWYRVFLKEPTFGPETRNLSGSPADYVAPHCPLCGHSKTFRLELLRDESTGDETDRWHCFHCKRSGDVRRLWGRLHFKICRTDWMDELKAKKSMQPISQCASGADEMDRMTPSDRFAWVEQNLIGLNLNKEVNA